MRFAKIIKYLLTTDKRTPLQDCIQTNVLKSEKLLQPLGVLGAGFVDFSIVESRQKSLYAWKSQSAIACGLCDSCKSAIKLFVFYVSKRTIACLWNFFD